jgi:hypothetical protein
MTLSQNPSQNPPQKPSSAEDARNDVDSGGGDVEPSPLPPPVAAITDKSGPHGLHLLKTLPTLRSTGYGLLLLAFVDLLYVLIPLELTNPVWEYQTTGDLIRLVPVPMLAFMLVFYGEATSRRRIERPILRALSWSTLIFGVILLLLIPLTVINTVRISRYNNDQISIQINQQKLQLDNTKSQLEKASPSQLQSLIPTPDEKTGNLPDMPKTPEEAKAQILSNIQKARETAEAQAAQARKNVKQNLTKNSIKLMVEALIAGCLFLYNWHVTSWARRRFAAAYEMVDAQAGIAAPSGNFPGSRRRRRR